MGGGVNESLGLPNTQMNGALLAGLQVLSEDQEIIFTVYTRKILPVDGFVFWDPTSNPQVVKVKGSLHYVQDIEQNVDETVGVGPVVFTAKSQITDFSQAGLNQLFVAKVGSFRYAFRGQKGFYQQADIWHYVGSTIPPALEPQLLDPGNPVDLTQAVVSNSLPLWLAMNGYNPSYAGLTLPLTLYPAMLVTENLVPPYGVVDVIRTEPIQSTPLRGVNGFGLHTQLVKDTVEITTYGLQNNAALTLQDFVDQYSLDLDTLGVMTPWAPVDEKRGQAELRTLAMKKTYSIDVSYYQSQSITAALQLILSAGLAYYTGH
jgi:hypothetical protein